MDQQPRVETVEEFKLRIAAIIRGKPEHNPGAPHPLLFRHRKRAKSKKTTSLGSGFLHVTTWHPPEFVNCRF